MWFLQKAFFSIIVYYMRGLTDSFYSDGKRQAESERIKTEKRGIIALSTCYSRGYWSHCKEGRITFTTNILSEWNIQGLGANADL